MGFTSPGTGWCRFLVVPVAAVFAPLTILSGTAQGDVVISEFLAHNTANQVDGDGEFSDWIELHNRSSVEVRIPGTSLTDDPTDRRKWVFPDVAIAAGGRLLVFASGKDRRDPSGELHTNFQLDRAGEYLAFIAADGTVVTEFAPAFPPQRADVSYGIGLPGSAATTDLTPTGFIAGLNFANMSVAVGGGASELGAFNLLDNGLAGGSGQRYLWADYEAELRRIPAGHGTVLSATLAWSGELVETFGPFSTRVGVFPVPGDDKGASTVFPTSDAGAMAAYYAANEPFADRQLSSPGVRFIVFDVTEMVAAWLADPDMPGRGQFMTLASGGPMRIVWDSGGPRLTVETTIGGGPGPQPVFFLQPTPLLPEHSAVQGFVEDTRFSADRGIFAAPFEVVVTTGTEGATVYATTDGSAPIDAAGNPTATAAEVAGPLAITRTTTLRAAAVRPGWMPTNTDTQTYIFPEDTAGQGRPEDYPESWAEGLEADYDVDPRISLAVGGSSAFAAALQALPVISVVGDSGGVFGRDGVYVSSPVGGAELPVSVEWIPGGAGGGAFQTDAGLVAEPGGRAGGPADPAKRALGLRFRGEYGAAKLEYPLFGDGDGAVARFDGLRLRTADADGWGGSDPDGRARASFLRDPWVRRTLRAMGNSDGGQSRFTHLFINGLYWGVYEVAERFDGDHFAEYLGGGGGGVVAYRPSAATPGEQAAFNRLRTVVSTRDWEAVQQVLDVDSYIDWFIVQHFARNTTLLDGGGWSATGGGTSGSRWRFYVAEAGGSLGDPGPNGDFPLDVDGGAGLIVDLSAIAEFRVRFADRAHRHLSPEGALTNGSCRQRFGELATGLEAALLAESARWGDRFPGGGGVGGVYTGDPDWTRAVGGPLPVSPVGGVLGSWFPEGGKDRTTHLKESWSTVAWPGSGSDDPLLLGVRAPQFTVNGLPQHGGAVAPGDVVGADAGAGDIYFTTDGSDPRLEGGAVAASATELVDSVPVVATARAQMRARVGERWSPLVAATFSAGVPAGAGNTILAEIHYHPADPDASESAALPGITANDFEFVEVYNPTAVGVDLSGVGFTNGIAFTAPPGAWLEAGQRAVVVRNLDAFRHRYRDLDPEPVVLGVFGGSLDNSGEPILLEAASGTAIAAFRFDDKAPWPEGADGDGYSLTLSCPDLGIDYTDPLAWRPSRTAGGTPGYDDSISFDDWSAAGGGSGGDALIRFALAGPGALTSGVKVFSASGTTADFPFVRYRQRTGAEVELRVELSDDLRTWTGLGDPALVESRDSTGDGFEEVTVRAPNPVGGRPVFFRLLVGQKL